MRVEAAPSKGVLDELGTGPLAEGAEAVGMTPVDATAMVALTGYEGAMVAWVAEMVEVMLTGAEPVGELDKVTVLTRVTVEVMYTVAS